MIRVAIADDHDLIRDGFSKLLGYEDDIRLVGEARNAGELFQLLGRITVDILVLDIGLPDRNGLEVLKEIRVRYPHVKTLILSMHPEARYARRALSDGAAGYVTKDTASEDLVTAVRRVFFRGRYISEALADTLVNRSDSNAETLPHTTLSDREYELLLLLGEGKTVREISEILSLSINTVNSYRRRLLSKMNLESNSAVIRYVLQYNLIE
jgi:two-component system, NarL family, invasion response regulator UvrY